MTLDQGRKLPSNPGLEEQRRHHEEHHRLLHQEQVLRPARHVLPGARASGQLAFCQLAF
jgi:hypothetical protein